MVRDGSLILMHVSSIRQLFTHQAFLAFPKGCLQLRRELLNRAVNISMVNLDAALFYYFCQVPVAERISEIPAHTGQDDVFFEAVSFEVDHTGNLGGVRWALSLP